MDEDNYKEAMEASFKVFGPRGISKWLYEERLVFGAHRDCKNLMFQYIVAYI